MTGFLDSSFSKDLVSSSIYYLLVGLVSLFNDLLFSNVYIFLKLSLFLDLSPQDSTLLADIVEVGSLPSYTREFDETHHCFYILTRQGLRFECSSTSKTQVRVNTK